MNIDLIILLLILILLTFMFVREIFAIEVAAFIAVSLLLVFNIISIDDLTEAAKKVVELSNK